MLDQSLFELATASCFSSPALAGVLRDWLTANEPAHDALSRLQFHQRCLARVRMDLDADYPRRFRLNDMDTSLQTLWPEQLFFGHKGGELPMLDALYGQLFVENGDVIHYRDDQVQAYVRTAARLDPSLIVGWRIAKRLHDAQRLNCKDAMRIVAAQKPFFSAPAYEGQAFAENHVHLGGVHYDGLVLMSGLSEPLGNVFNDPALEALAPLQRLTRHLLMRTGNDTLTDSVRDIKASLGKQHYTQDNIVIHWRWLAEQQISYADRPDEANWQRQQIARHLVSGDMGKAWLWFTIWGWTQFQRRDCPSELRMALFYLFNSLTHLRRRLLMDGQGLTRFVEVYNNSARRNLGWHRQYTDAARRIFHGPQDVAELKVSHHQYSPDAIVEWLQHLKRATGLKSANRFSPAPADEHSSLRQAFERWHLCIHLIREAASRNNPAHVWREVDALQQKLNSEALWDRPELLNTSTQWSGRLQPTRWVRGLDVAGDENLAKIEVFAPALRWLRQGLQSQPFRREAARGLHLSIHAGEDYAHPLSGMRHVDETVRFCQMRAGDRLGHALALGIEPEEWLRRQGESVMELDEYVDNLVWAWHHAGEMSPHLGLASQVLPWLEQKLRRLTPYVSWLTSIEGNGACTPDLLYRAWTLRRNCYEYWRRERISALDDARIKVAVPDLDILNNHANDHAARLWTARWETLVGLRGSSDTALLTPTAPKKPYKVRICKTQHSQPYDPNIGHTLNLITVSENSHEVQFMHALQDWLLDKYDRLGLVIEANPTSNVYIARLLHHAEHPVFRWYPPDEGTLKPGERNNLYGLRRGPIKLCINTDDPGIMPTTLRTEFELLREAAQQHGVSRTQAESWLERIRQFGLDQFHQKHETLWH